MNSHSNYICSRPFVGSYIILISIECKKVEIAKLAKYVAKNRGLAKLILYYVQVPSTKNIQCVSPKHVIFSAGLDLAYYMYLHDMLIMYIILVPLSPHKLLKSDCWQFSNSGRNQLFLVLFILHKIDFTK